VPEWLIDLGVNLAAAAIGGAAVYVAGRVRAARRRRALRRSIGEFFGDSQNGSLLIIHSAIFDEDERAFNYPATDTRSARLLASLFDQVGLQ
jgi:hypothetical protein